MKSLTEWLERRGGEVAHRKAGHIAAELRERLSGGHVEAREAAVIISGKGLVKRWLIDPELRFLSGDWR